MSNTLVKQLFEINNCDFVAMNDVERDGRAIKLVTLKYDGPKPDCCPHCHGKMYKHGDRKVNVLDTPMTGKPVVLNITVPRYRCQNPACNYIWQPEVDNIDSRRQVTNRAFVDITERSLRMTFEQVCEDYAFSPNTAKNIFLDFLNEKAEKMRFKTPCFLGIDEIKIKKIGEVTVVTDLEHHTLFDMFRGRYKERLMEYFTALPGTENILWVCSDMYRPFEDTLKSTMPNARWVIDHFHVVAKANEALDYVRRCVQSSLPKQSRIKTKKGLAYTLKMRYNSLSTEDQEKIRLLRQNPKMRILADAYDLKEDFFNIYDNNLQSKDNAIAAFKAWEESISFEPEFDKFREVAEMVHRHFEAIFAWWDCPSAISNGYTECINRLIRENNLRGRGYSFEILRGRTLYRKSNLKNLEENGLLYGPEIREYGPNFLFENTQEEEEIDFNSEEDDTIDGTYDPETGEIFEDQEPKEQEPFFF